MIIGDGVYEDRNMINRYLIQKQAGTFYLMRQTVDLVETGPGEVRERHSDWERIFCSVSHEIVLEQYRKIDFAGELLDLETFGEGTYGEGFYGPV